MEENQSIQQTAKVGMLDMNGKRIGLGRRLLVATSGAILALSVTLTPAYAGVVNSYTSTLTVSTWVTGAYRTYGGTAIHIQLNTTASQNGTYQIQVLRKDCIPGGGVCWGTVVGSAGNCPYNGFCSLSWNINLGGLQYAFYFSKPSDGVTVSSTNVQMWSTN
ncbi:MAG: hypothetical protein C0498_13450 [Anaerolinea sp.]|jgi:hypothetical protein|nr:hypothetical protein [Anaerolinea sp.]